MNETSKACMRRYGDGAFHSRYFVGDGIDIGGGIDSLEQYKGSFCGISSVRSWDIQDGDAQYLCGLADESFDFVYSSHCLEHMRDIEVALGNWLRVLRPGGYLVVTVPDEDMYECGIWPSPHNFDHKWSFTVYKSISVLPFSKNILDLVRYFSDVIDCERVYQIRDHHKATHEVSDQTLGAAECSIEFVWRKKTYSLEYLMNNAKFSEEENSIEKCIFFYTKAINEFKNSVYAYNWLANLYSRNGRANDGLKVWDLCVENNPELSLAKYFRSLYLISMGDFDTGFRLRDPFVVDAVRSPILPPKLYPRWRSESLLGKSIVIWTEFGFGDEIMFSRFVTVFKRDLGAAKVSIVCQDKLKLLFNSLVDVDNVISVSEVETLDQHDFWIYPHTIPCFYSLNINGVPKYDRYLFSDTKKFEWAKGLLPKKIAGRRRVGVVWKGSCTHENDNLRSIHNISIIDPLFAIKDIDWISLQTGGAELDLDKLPERSIYKVGDKLLCFADTAAVCQHLDAIVSVDTSVAHLAGALGIPVLLMLSCFSDWRWGVDEDKSAWYPNTEIFRQRKFDDWAPVVEAVVESLAVSKIT